MRLDDLLEGMDSLDHMNLFGDMEVDRVVSDSRKVVPGSVFVAIPGTQYDGHRFIAQALAAGASVVVQSAPLDPDATGSFVRVSDSRRAYALLNARLFGNPSEKLRVIGITGTNGKTSTALLLGHLLNSAGRRAAVLGTLGLLRPGAAEFLSGSLTTPDAADIQQMLANLVREGATHLVMEVSSHALQQQRVAGIRFAGGVFTNLSQDHFDYHGSMQEYAAAKEILFKDYLAPQGGYAVINLDDETGRAYASRFDGLLLKYGTERASNLVITEPQADASGVRWKLVLKNGIWPASLAEDSNMACLSCSLAGDFQVFNCTAAVGVALLEGLELSQVKDALAAFSNVPGRLQRVPNPAGINVYVDYAHTPDAVDNVVSALGRLVPQGNRLITVVGCGGDRDRSKRPQMGRIAQQGSGLSIFTSDNPRTEDPSAIIDEILAGLDPDGGPWLRVEDRREAIQRALAEASAGDIVLIAGKGHEDYQILRDRTIHFSDSEEVEKYFAGQGGSIT
ncbi:UDP-N-acetylmuramoyl-L-alanyl-D-glutamate--2,6-diaminopimelate ligase [bacterium]|nr:UDP-N-acetylmuramoyl-L-alanyl-D-glutamate--2,6-diaminopimelate ligase [bacterium]